jgi:iron complex transport system substrate-binding protein
MNSKYAVIGVIVIVIVAALVGIVYWQSTMTSTQPITQNNITATGYPLTITDADGRNVTFTAPPQRIICFAPSITEDVFSLNLSSNVIAVDTYSDYPPLLMQLENSGNITTVGGYITPDIEKIASLQPDVVFLDQALEDSFVAPLQDLNITVVVLSENSISDVENNLLLIGKITNHNAEAIAQVNQINSTIQYVTEKLKNVAPVSVMELAGPPEEGMWSAGNGTFINDIINIAGGTNMFANDSGWYQPTGEDVLSGNPQVVIMDTMDLLGYTPQQITTYFDTQPGFNTINAVANNQFYVLYGQAGNAVERLGPRVSDAILLYAYILHPSVFNVTLPLALGDNYTQYIGS